MTWRILRRAREALPLSPDPSIPPGTVTFLQKWTGAAGHFNRGESATFGVPLARWLVAQGIAKPGSHRLSALPRPAQPSDFDTDEHLWHPGWPHWITKG